MLIIEDLNKYLINFELHFPTFQIRIQTLIITFHSTCFHSEILMIFQVKARKSESSIPHVQFPYMS